MKKKLLAALLLIALLATSLPVASAAQSKLVALTFDDGPGPYTQRLLDGLAAKGVKATFFCLGSNASRYQDTVRRIFNEGHQVANHSYDHPNLNALSTDSACSQITRTDTILNEITGGSEAHFVRPPYGNSTQALRSRLNAPVFIWSVDTLDWKVRNAEKVKNNILNDTFDGAVVLVHDIHSFTVDGVLSALDTLIDRGYEFVTLKELYRRRGVALTNGALHYSCKPNGTDLGPIEMPEVTVQKTDGDLVEISFSSPSGAPVYYTLDGSELTYDSAQYTGPFTAQLPCTIRAVAAWDLNGSRSDALHAEYTQPQAGAPSVYVSDGQVQFESSDPEEDVYVALNNDDALTWGQPWTELEIPTDTWFSYYADGEGLAPSPVQRLLFTAEGNLFSDVQQDAWYYSAMDHGASVGYFQGRVMNADGILTRGMFTELLYRRAEQTDIEVMDMPFSDVPESAYYADAVKWAYANHVINGMGNGRFEPERPVTRQEMARIFAAYLDLTPFAGNSTVQYTDRRQIADWAKEAVQAVTDQGLMQGSDGRFRPLGTATRAEIATILLRLDQPEY